MLTLAAVADHKGIELGTLDVRVERSTEGGRPQRTVFAVKIDLGPGLSQRERIILFNSARRCEVYKLLSGDISFEYQLLDG